MRTTLRRRTDARSRSALGLFEVLSEAIVALDDAGMVADLNPAAERFFGCEAADTRGKPVHEMLDVPPDEIVRMISEAASPPGRRTLTARTAGGRRRTVNVELMQLTPEQGGPAGWRTVLCLDLRRRPVQSAPIAPWLRTFPEEQHRDRDRCEQNAAERAAPNTDSGFSANCDFRILLIDDNFDANESIACLLRLLDYDVRTAGDAAAALTALIDFEPHLILSDIGLPGIDGYTLAPLMRKAAGGRKLLIAAATGYGMPGDRERARDAGFDFHLLKPLDADALLAFVAEQFVAYESGRNQGP